MKHIYQVYFIHLNHLNPYCIVSGKKKKKYSQKDLCACSLCLTTSKGFKDSIYSVKNIVSGTVLGEIKQGSDMDFF